MPLRLFKDKQKEYDQAFYEKNTENLYSSAETIISIIKSYYSPASVIDVGCGLGAWLKAWSENGVQDFLGLDGTSVPPSAYLIPQENFRCVNFEEWEQNITRTFDLAMSLEVAEHLSADASDGFVKNLTTLSDIILFSAAVPYQGGRHHVNCQPLDYWAKKFIVLGYECFDIIRPKLLQQHQKVQPWYVQNTLLFVKKRKSALFTQHGLQPIDTPLTIYHQQFMQRILQKSSWKYHVQKIRQKLVQFSKL